MDPDALAPGRRLALLANLEGLRAEEALAEHGGELTPESLRAMVLRATGSEDAADKAFSRRVLELERERANRGG